ncbi:hypothetical protein BC835DRAFT_882851 [Cytidiella melzeri]|nr:hypothetical protein BC835DRAFT_882851 [Cytidiella melzeri]
MMRTSGSQWARYWTREPQFTEPPTNPMRPANQTRQDNQVRPTPIAGTGRYSAIGELSIWRWITAIDLDVATKAVPDRCAAIVHVGCLENIAEWNTHRRIEANRLRFVLT